MTPSRCRFLTLVLLAAFGFTHHPLRAQAPTAHCPADPGREALLEWVGDWQIIDEAGEVSGSSTVREILAGCALEEARRRADGSEEIGLTFFDRATESWRQRWVSSLGHTGLLDLTFEPGGVVIAGSVHGADGGDTRVRAFVAARPAGGFEERLQLSSDGGASYSAAGVTLYLPLGRQVSTPQSPSPAREATPVPQPSPAEPAPGPARSAQPGAEPAVEPATAPGNEPAAEPASEPSAKVTLRSKRKADAEAQETAMESPMALEFELGPLADLPAGAAWRTTELAPYVADRVNIPRVTAQLRERKGETALELVVNLRTKAGQSKVDLDVTLLAEGTSVASERVEGVSLGKLVSAHDPQDGSPQTVRLTVERAAFAALFADGKRPSVRLTVTVR